MLKITRITGSAANSKKTEGKNGGNSVVSNMFGDGEATNPTKRKNQMKITKSKFLVKSKNYDFLTSRIEKAGTGFFIPKAWLTFI